MDSGEFNLGLQALQESPFNCWTISPVPQDSLLTKPSKNQNISSIFSTYNGKELTFPFQKGRFGAWKGNIRPKQDPNPAEQTSNPAAPCPVSETHDEILWVPEGLSISASPAVLPGQDPSKPTAFYGDYPRVLAFLKSWDLNFNFGFTFTASCSSLTGSSCRDFDPVSQCLASAAVCNWCNPSHFEFFIFPKPVPCDAAKFCCQPGWSLALGLSCSSLCWPSEADTSFCIFPWELVFLLVQAFNAFNGLGLALRASLLLFQGRAVGLSLMTVLSLTVAAEVATVSGAGTWNLLTLLSMPSFIFSYLFALYIPLFHCRYE